MTKKPIVKPVLTCEDVEGSIVRSNLRDDPSYRPYVGCDHMRRARFDGRQFVCSCGWTSQYPEEWIAKWLNTHKRHEGFTDPPGHRRH